MTALHSRTRCDWCSRPVGDAALVTVTLPTGPWRLCPECATGATTTRVVPEPVRLHADEPDTIDTEPPGDDEWRCDGEHARDALGLALAVAFWAVAVAAGAAMGAWLAGVL
ncbi:hypothetical protein [Cellulomonas composti]|uniref:Uncharacterized protein n=1 Tax=Cellulomonas composti TaxID=266130 RepID=A0A511JBM4_9CELL|nr:hypothetical protein [Cellulomonas composti]GEL95387.1 hypothetical protein CCO02nite_20450 [Cellulomonas composti]